MAAREGKSEGEAWVMVMGGGADAAADIWNFLCLRCRLASMISCGLIVRRAQSDSGKFLQRAV